MGVEDVSQIGPVQVGVQWQAFLIALMNFGDFLNQHYATDCNSNVLVAMMRV